MKCVDAPRPGWMSAIKRGTCCEAGLDVWRLMKVGGDECGMRNDALDMGKT